MAVRGDSGEVDGARADAEAPKGGKLIRSVLAPALRLWLRSQVESVEHLAVGIDGGDRQIVSGKIPALTVAASRAVYRGLHLSEISLVGRNIRMNLGQAVRGKPLRLMEPIKVTADLVLQPQDLNLSLGSAILAPALKPWLAQFALLLGEGAESSSFGSGSGQPSGRIEEPQVVFGQDVLRMDARWVEAGDAVGGEVEDNAASQPLALQLQLEIADGNVLMVKNLRWLAPPPASLRSNLETLEIPPFKLGDDVAFESFAINPDGITCRGLITINP